MTSCNNLEIELAQLLPLIQEKLSGGQTVTFSPRGISMLPMLRQGIDSVVLSPIPGVLKKYDLPLYRRKNGQFVLHRVVRVGEAYTMCGDNQYVCEAGICQDQLIGLVTGFYRNKKFCSVTGFFYRVYCTVWCSSRPLRYFCFRGVRYLHRRLKR